MMVSPSALDSAGASSSCAAADVANDKAIARAASEVEIDVALATTPRATGLRMMLLSCCGTLRGNTRANASNREEL
jgi:hypothetical protein